MPPQLHDIIDGRYRVLGVLGQGGAGRVYRVEDTTRSGETVALKVLERTDEKWAAAFRREFETLAAMSHPNVVRVIDFGPGPDPGTAYFTAELVVGEDIFRYTENVDTSEKLALLTELVRALGFVHNRGILHRDLKPANILVDRRAAPGERVKLVDFGLARGAARMGKVTLFAGTPPYMAPELLEGQSPSVLTDLYALGVTAYRMFRRELPYQAKTAAALQIARSEGPPPPLPPDVSLEITHLINTLMDPEPAKRPASAALVSAALERSDLGHAPPPVVLGEAPLLGRVIQMSVLKLAYETGVRERQAGVVLLTGPAGLGRSRLLGAFEDTVQLVGGRVASTRAEAGVTHPHPLVTLARGVLSFAGRSSPPASQKLLADASKGAVPQDVVGMGALAAALDAGLEPRAIILDDAHLADEATLLALCFLASQPVAPRVLILSARDDGTVRWPDQLRALAALDGVKRVTLGPLNQADSRALGASLLGRTTLPVALLKAVDAGKGVPRLIEDAVKRLVPMGALKAGKQGLTYVVPNPLMQKELSARVDALEPDDRLILAALVLAQTPVGIGALALGMDRAPTAVQVGVGTLKQAGLVRQRGTDPDGAPLYVVETGEDADGTQTADRVIRSVVAEGTLQVAQRGAARILLQLGGQGERAAELLITSGLGDDTARALLAAAEERPHARDAALLASAALEADRAARGTVLNDGERARAARFLERTDVGR